MAPPARLPASVLLSGGQAPFTSPRDFQTSLAADVRKAWDLGLTCRGMVCVLKGFSGGGYPPTPPRPPYRPRCCLMKRVFKLSTGEPKWCCGGARAGPPGDGSGGAKSKLWVPLPNVTRVIFEVTFFLVLNKGAWLSSSSSRSRSSSRGVVCVADRDVHKHMHTCTGNSNTQSTQPPAVT